MFRFLILSAVWLLWSGHYSLNEPLIATFGVLSCLAVALLSHRMGREVPGGMARTLTWRTLRYLPWLVKEIVKSNLAVAKIVLDPKLPISPCIVRVKASQRGEGALVLFANSITLTPGTISLATEGDSVVVHALTREIADDLESGEMNRRVAALEGKA